MCVTLCPYLPTEAAGEPKRKPRRDRSASSDTSVESRVESFRLPLSKRGAQSSGPRSSSNDSGGTRKRKPNRPTPRDSTPGGSGDGSGRQSRFSVHSSARVRLPGFLRQPVPRGTASPVSIRADRKIHKRKKRGWGCIADALTANQVLKEGEKEATSDRLIGRTLFAMLGFGQFEIEWGVGCYGGGFTECIRAIATDHAEDLRRNNIRCEITNRLAFGISNLKCGSKKFGTEDERSVLFGDLPPVSKAILDDYVLTDTKAEVPPVQPQDVETFRRCAENRANARCMFCGKSIVLKERSVWRPCWIYMKTCRSCSAWHLS